ncbi:uncharacterized protein LAESUDRAFT_640616 [Laetiporus sulphureus 93-53]|uniref:ARM repeat-containing protein n=1 Tax=Laetiporus sulphureus 93-53 TaxID=1314785 RepID=A0A165I6B8_9APHY|nr:uncharacterized protein LAESUDRAFT_640616 [Laetiporus sulphureus 93-53]KZT12651.1 hypothetical protein LAESUDRAFT_640616 [Laetiporus sulphureus 93-53]
MDIRDDDALKNSLDALEIPEEFARYHAITDAQLISLLDEWRSNVQNALADLRTLLQARELLSVNEKAKVISVLAPLDGHDPWMLGSTREQAQDILQRFSSPETPLLEQVLTQHVKAVFQANPHPMLNVSTGRTRTRLMGGPLATLDHYGGQLWKARPGAVNLVSWCVRHCDSVAYEKLWHLIIPPMMTILDDYEAMYKLQGIHIVAEMLVHVPADLLRRTGVDGLLFSSLKKCLTYLHNSETPELIHQTVPTAISLIQLTTAPHSAKRFEQLCEVLGDGIVGSVWIYATRESDAIEASVDVLPEAVQALDIGAARYLKAIIPQLVYTLVPMPENRASKQFQLSSLRAMCSVIRVCAPRMHKWKRIILEGTLKCWVSLVDIGADDDRGCSQLMSALRKVCGCLLEACPSLAQDEYARLLQLDRQTFDPLVGGLAANDS